MDFIEHDRNPHDKHQTGKEAQRVRGDMRGDVSPEEERERVMHQINKQRRIHEVGHAAGLKVQQAVAEREYYVHHP